jgi:hypothetical protein
MARKLEGNIGKKTVGRKVNVSGRWEGNRSIFV